MNPQREKFETAAIRTLAVIGLIAILALGLWGSVALTRNASGLFSGISNSLSAAAVYLSSIFREAEDLQTTIVPMTVRNNEQFTVGWMHTGVQKSGTYEITYACRDDLTLSASSAKDASRFSPIACDKSLTVPTGSNLALKAESKKNRFLDVPITVSFRPEGAHEPSVSSVAIITIVNETVAASPDTTGTPSAGGPTGNSTSNNSHLADAGTDTTATTSNTNGSLNVGATTSTTTQISGSGSSRTDDPNGKPDLKVTFIETGYVDKATGEFFASSTVMSTMRIAVRFTIENAGTKTSPQWSFNAVLPTSPNHTFHSTGQRELKPGERIEYTLGFDQTKAEEIVEVIVNADPTRNINELDETNNIVKQEIDLYVSK